MSDISTEELKNEINAILKVADLSVVSAKKVREQVEKKLNCKLLSRKKEFDTIVMDFINSQQEEEEEEEGDDDAAADEEEEDKDGSASEEEAASSEEDKSAAKKKKGAAAPAAAAGKKRPQPTQRKAVAGKKKRKSLTASDSGTESDGSDSDFEMPKKSPVKRKKGAGGAAAAGGKRKSTGFTRAYNLSPELSGLMGAESMPRHEVVKKVWAIIKERNLYDPKNKQFAICDDDLFKVMKVKRFRTFGMLKHLKDHFIN